MYSKYRGLTRFKVLWRGVPDSELGKWKAEKRMIEAHDKGLDWRKKYVPRRHGLLVADTAQRGLQRGLH